MRVAFLLIAICGVLLNQALAQTGSSSDGWGRFADPTLDSLLSLGLRENPDLQNALSRVQEARLRIGIAESYLAPSVRTNPLISTQSLAPNRPVQIPIASELPRFQLTTYSLPIDVSYELDAFRRLRNGVKLADLQAQITQSDYQAVRLTVAAEIARIYFLVRANDAEQAVFGRSLAARDSVLAILRERFRVGLSNEIDAKRAETEIAGLRAQQLNLLRSRVELVNGLAVLVGRDPVTFSLPPKELGPLPLAPYEQIPAESLRKRPDLVQAEQQTRAAETGIDIARAGLLPRIALNGSAGLLSGHVEKWFLPSSAYYLAGVSASVPIFEGKRAQQNLTLARQQRTTAQTVTQQRLFTARREAEVAFDNVRYFRQQVEAQLLTVGTARQTERLARELYLKGLSTYLDVLDAQRTTLDAERTLTQLQGQVYVNTTLLFKALGGDW
jgi:multidrug efflux system outer membrane protein